MKSEKCFRFLQ